MAEQEAVQKGEPAQKAQQQKKEETIVLKDKQARILLSLKNSDSEWYISSLAKATNTTYVHACRFIGMCERRGITSSERHGKIKVIKLTEKGLQIAEMATSIYNLLAQPGVSQQKTATQPKQPSA
ncbi:MAG: hypothetical protein M1528_03095 [Candidatus Marsarchaeota archaeon]|jgi:predicted transcriptional regulator|nr:hypothetical protein [Candidatus Marsarchaeota archaeon]MCL5115493.1 hypothetical protein [Candidatus Marsarchaeota archaeon]